ncbi:hypothetical protein [Cumulibacter soli]|uniref:hypothetical protein n=1 Tax=Cumulibacter soli TaxID=2546344 RepID=UPI00106872E2|nr:hypothetical protein [Cumulibacter soli]
MSPAPATGGAPTAPPPSRVTKYAWRLLVILLPLTTLLLFFPWTTNAITPSVDVRPELVWSSVATIVIGAIALAFPNRWMSYTAALPTIGALTDLGPVLMPESGEYPLVVRINVIVVALIGIAWMTMAMGYPAREQQTRWIVAPVAAALTVATLWLPWLVIFGIGQQSGQATAIDVLFSTYATAAPGVVFTRLSVLIIMIVGIVGAVLPLLSRTSRATRIAMGMTLASTVALVLLCLWLSMPGDSVQPADYASGPRVAIAGFAIITLVWNSRLKAAGGPDDAPPPRRIDDSGYIPVIMSGSLHSDPPTPRQFTPGLDLTHLPGTDPNQSTGPHGTIGNTLSGGPAYGTRMF